MRVAMEDRERPGRLRNGIRRSGIECESVEMSIESISIALDVQRTID